MQRFTGRFLLDDQLRFVTIEARDSAVVSDCGDGCPRVGQSLQGAAEGRLWAILHAPLARARTLRSTVTETRDGYALEVTPTDGGIWVQMTPAHPVALVVRPIPEQATEDEFFHRSPDILCILSATEGRLLRVNPAWEHVLGYKPEDLHDRSILDLVHVDDRIEAYSALQRALHSEDSDPEARVFTCRCRSASGVYRDLQWSAAPRPDSDHIYAAARDVTEIRIVTAELRRQITQHPVTQLPNRRHLDEELPRIIAEAQRNRRAVAVLFIDLDRFKPINDTFGHDVGDQMLQIVGRRLVNVLRGEDLVVHLGGDEFVVVLPAIGPPNDAVAVAQKLIQTIQEPCRLEGNDLCVSATIGISISPYDGTEARDLVKFADTAMYRAKKEGRGGFALYTSEIIVESQNRLALESRLGMAVDRRELTLHYQPQVHAMNPQHLVGFEALIRWNHEILGLVQPSAFIPLAEETGIIRSMGLWALTEAARQAVEWHAVTQGLKIAVNVSNRQLVEAPNLIQQVREVLENSALPPECLDLEITESAFVHVESGIKDTLFKLKDMGVMLSVDDFGTGYSALSHLARLPVDRVKIDRSFIQNMCESPADEAVIRAVIDLTHTLGMQVVAEGVETQEQLEKLKALECDIIQGYLFGRPLPPSHALLQLAPKK